MNTIANAFDANWVAKDGSLSTQCHVWQRAKIPSGYGSISIGGRRVYAHRFSYERSNGQIPPHHVVMHLCDNPSCVNPDHLKAATQKENIRDKYRKGRGAKGPVGFARLTADEMKQVRSRIRYNSGDRHHMAKLTAADAERIKDMLAMGRSSQVEIGRYFGVSGSTISLISTGKCWS